MNLSMFERASVRLTGLYLLIIMSISFLFSISLYQLSSQKIEESVRRPNSFAQVLRINNLEGIQEFLEGQDVAVAKAKRDIRFSLYIINLFIFIAGGCLSYYLARRSLRPIEKAHEAQSRFTSDASHELRTPIAAMRLENELTLTDPKLTVSNAKKQLESNLEELDKLTALTEGLLQLSRLEDDKLTKEPTASSSVIELAIAKTKPQIESKKQKISWSKRKININVNKEALSQAISILLSNASKYSPEKSTISISVKPDNKHVIISVTDTGIGIEPIEYEKIFERFYRSDSSRTKNDSEGYGIGLSIAKKIIELHGGTISVSSVVNKGSTFSVSLPK